MAEITDKLDHRVLGTQLKLFTFFDATPGMAFWLPNGSTLRKRLENLIYDAHLRRNYKPVQTPAMMEDTMWKVSGHYDNYKDNMFPSEVEKRDYLLKPMNCPMHTLIYKTDVHSYKSLPLRMFEFGQVHRNELSGALHGLFRVREFTQDDAHIFCTETQLESEIIEVMKFIESTLEAFGFEYVVNLSTKPDKAIGSDDVWEKAENSIKSALKTFGKDYILNEGDGAFYGPKIDVKIKDKHGREWQLSTVQIDFNLPERFDLTYIDENGEKQRPVMIHRAILGSFERFIGILLEHYEGLLPLSISHSMVAIVPVSTESDKQRNYIAYIKEEFGTDITYKVYDDGNTFNKRIKMAEEDKNCIVLIVGESEVEDNTVNLRHKIKQQRYSQDFERFIMDLYLDSSLSI